MGGRVLRVDVVFFVGWGIGVWGGWVWVWRDEEGVHKNIM